MPPAVSIITSFLNEERYLQQAIESVRSQSFRDWELILVDDGSTDGSSEMARTYARESEGQIKYLDHEHHANRGLSPSLNEGISVARGNYVAFLDADDVWLSNKLEDQLALLEQYPLASAVYGGLCYWESWTQTPAAKDEIFYPEVGKDSLVAPPRLLLETYPLGQGTPPGPSDILVRRDALMRLGGFESQFVGIYGRFSDQAFFAKLHLNDSVYVAGKCWTKYRLREGSICATTNSPKLYRETRLFFFDFLQQYLQRQKIESAEVWRAVNTATRRTRYPRFFQVTNRLARLFSR